MDAAKAMKPYGRSFFERAPDDVAHDLIGSVLLVRGEFGVRRARIVETEAYAGFDDPGSHAYRGRTPRTEVMFGPAGFLYVYLIYGMHWCVNVVTEVTGTPSAVLLRGAMLFRDDLSDDATVSLKGPGNLTKGLGITGSDSGIDCCDPDSRVVFLPGESPFAKGAIGISRRVGLSRGRERESRYYLDGDKAVSRIPPRDR
ncbi:MAG: DNA-3-methyladenine glycosylase [Acidimicrobiales bacterium]